MKDGNDITIVATGLEVGEALKAAEMLEADGISAAVINIRTIKPLDEILILKYAELTKKAIKLIEKYGLDAMGIHGKIKEWIKSDI